MLLCTTAYLTYCDHITAQVYMPEAILLLTTACCTLPIVGYVMQSYAVQSTFNSKETIHWCLLTLIMLSDYL